MRTVSATPLVPAVANVGTIAIDAQMLIIIQLSIFRLFKTDGRQKTIKFVLYTAPYV